MVRKPQRRQPEFRTARMQKFLALRLALRMEISLAALGARIRSATNTLAPSTLSA